MSHQLIGLPPWARTGPEDDAPAGPYSVKRPLPETFDLTGDARCRCGAVVDDSAAAERLSCTVYDHSGAYKSTVEVRRCTKCPPKSRMAAGPDLGEFGLFNFNNHTILSHTLLNKYDSMVASNETTFHGFCNTMAREYEMCGSTVPFMGEDRFRTSWFSFLNLQVCRDDFQCSICKEDPRVVVVDGVTVSFQKRMQTSTLQPPTHACEESARHEDVRTPKEKLQLVGDAKVRKPAVELVRWAMEGGRAAGAEQDMSIDQDQAPKGKKKKKKKAAASVEPPHNIKSIARKLRKSNTELATVFERYVRPHKDVPEGERHTSRLWLELLLQVRCDIRRFTGSLTSC